MSGRRKFLAIVIVLSLTPAICLLLWLRNVPKPPAVAFESSENYREHIDKRFWNQIDLVVQELNQGIPFSSTGYDLLKNAELKDLRNFQVAAPPGVALLAAWEEVLRGTFSDEVELATDDEEPKLRAIDLVSIDRFFNLAEQQLDVRIPLWWKNTIRSAKYRPRGGMFSEGLVLTANKYRPYHRVSPYRPSSYSWWAPSDTWIRMSRRERVMTISVRGQDFVFPVGALLGVASFTPICDGKNYYVAAHSLSRRTYQLICVNGESGRIAWKTEVGSTGMY